MPDSFQKRLPFNVPDCTANLNHDNVRLGNLGQLHKVLFDFAHDMRNNLDRTSVVIPSSFFGNYRGVYLAGSCIGNGGQLNIYKPFVIAKVKVCFCAVFRHKNFPVLVRAHIARVNIKVWVQLLYRNFYSPAFQDSANRSDSNPFTYRTYNATGYKNIFGHNIKLYVTA